jgi:hypothetical protein
MSALPLGNQNVGIAFRQSKRRHCL